MSDSTHIQPVPSDPLDIKFTLQTNDDDDIITVTVYSTLNGLTYIHDVSTYDIKEVILSFSIDGEFLGVIPNIDFYTNLQFEHEHELEHETEHETETVSNNKRRKGNDGQII